MHMNKRISVIFFVVLYLLLPHAVKAKAILLNEDSGLNNIEVTAITKDKSGMMWVATKRGLSKYDGNRFFRIQRLDGFVILTILYDSIRENMWVGTDRGLFYVDCKTDGVIQCTAIDEKNAVTCLLLSDGHIIAGFYNRYILRINVNTFASRVIYYFKKGLLSPTNMVCDTAGNIDLFIHKPGKLVRIYNKTGKTEVVDYNLPHIISFLAIAEHKLFSGAVNVRIKNIRGATPADWYLDSLKQIKWDPECMIGHNRSILIAYRNPSRVIEIIPAEKKIIDLSEGATDVFAYKRINCLFRDDYDITWVGTSKGLIKLIPDKLKPEFERLLWNEQPKLASTRQIIGDTNGDLYVASYAGLYRYKKSVDKWINVIDKIGFEGMPRPFSQRSLLDTGGRYIFVGSDANYFVVYDKKNQTAENLSRVSADGKCNTKGSTLALERDANGMIWIGSEVGLLSFDPVTSALQCHANDRFSIDGSVVRCFYMMPNKRQFWVGTENGVYLVDISAGTRAHFDMRTSPALGGNHINAISVNARGEIWIATGDAGINVLSADQRFVYTITKEDGLSSNEVYNMLWQDSTRLWLSTYNGLNYYHLPTQGVLQYCKSDGLTDNEFNQNSAYMDTRGKMYFGGVNGITAFYPPKVDLKEQPFDVFVSGITKWERASGKLVNIPPHDHLIEMNPGDNQLTFSFAVTNFTHPERHTYYYKIEEQNAEWIPLGSQPFLRLESLKGGNHTLLVKAVKGSRGETSTNTLAYQLLVRVEFYRTVWFYLLVLTGLATLIYLYYSDRLKTQKKLEIQRVKIASNLHDEVGSLLTRITMSADRLVTRMSRDSETRDKLEGVSALSREANVAMSDVLWTIDARNDFAGSLTDRMREHAEDLLLPRGIDISIDFSEIDQQQKLSPEFRQHLFLLYKEIINNIIKHSHAENVQITYKQTKEHFLLHVKNDGVPENKDTVSTGQGLRNIKMRAELLRGGVEILRGKKRL
jgi:ligand-binding sensor domain-containing protein